MKDVNVFAELEKKDIKMTPHLTNWGKAIIFLTAFFFYPIAVSLCLAFYHTDKEVALWYYKGVKIFGYFYVFVIIFTFIILIINSIS